MPSSGTQNDPYIEPPPFSPTYGIARAPFNNIGALYYVYDSIHKVGIFLYYEHGADGRAGGISVIPASYLFHPEQLELDIK